VSLGVAYLLLLVSLVALVVGVGQAYQGYEQQAEAVRRGRQDRGEPARRRLRYASDQRLRRTRLGRGVEERLTAAGIEVAPLDALVIATAATLSVWLPARLVIGPGVALLLAIATPFACSRYVVYRQGRRRDDFVAQLPELARVLSNASSAGLGLPRAIEIAVSELGKPASEVLRRVSDELRLGQSVGGALANMERRLPSREVKVIVSTLIIQQRAGGDTVSTLRGMAETLEARKDLRREVSTVMSGAILTGWAVPAIGVGMLVMMNLASPGLLEGMTRVWVGRVALFVGLGLFAIGFFAAERVTRVET